MLAWRRARWQADPHPPGGGGRLQRVFQLYRRFAALLILRPSALKDYFRKCRRQDRQGLLNNLRLLIIASRVRASCLRTAIVGQTHIEMSSVQQFLNISMTGCTCPVPNQGRNKSSLDPPSTQSALYHWYRQSGNEETSALLPRREIFATLPPRGS